jgi:anaerobic dimethyl sulfoxide reductase subunit A
MSNQNVNAKGYIKAHRNPKVEFVAAADFFMSTEARYADIILPATSLWEEEHYSLINPEIFIGNPNKIVEPLFEAKNDFEMEELLMRAAGADRGTAKSWSYPGERNIREHVVNGFLEMRVTLGGTSQYLLSFDNDDLNELGVNAVVTAGGTLTQGVIPYKQFKEKGFYQARVTEYNRQTRIPGLISFLSETPVFADNSASMGDNNHWKRSSTIATETGFYEIFSINLYNYYMNFWYDAPALDLNAANIGKLATDLTIPSQLLYPIPVYRKQPDGYEASRDGASYYNGTTISANEFPFQYISLHPHNRSHSTRNDNKHILELFDDLLFIHPETAAAAGSLAHGDTVILTSSMGGKIMRRVSISNTVIPGVLIGTEGCTVRHLDDEATTEAVDFDNVIDYGGAANSLTASFRVGQAHQAYNTVIVKMERAPGKLVPQYKWEPDLPESARTVVSDYYKTN